MWFREEVGPQSIHPACLPLLIALTEAELQIKIEAISRYRSQIEILFGTLDQMEERVRACCRQLAGGTGGAERFWRATE